MREANKNFRRKYENKKDENEPKLVTRDDIKRAIEFKKNRTDTRLSAEEVAKTRQRIKLEESLVDIIYKRDIDDTSRLEKNRADRQLSKESIEAAINEKNERRAKSKKQNETSEKEVCDDKEIGD